MSALKNEIRRHHGECQIRMLHAPDGPWKKEPHRVSFEHAGFPCLLVRVPHHLAWCGYVGVPKGHPLHGKGYDGIEGLGDVHGGLTYAESCNGAICHLPADGEDDHVWWFGFDSAHCYDLSPINGRALYADQVYRDVPYMTAEVRKLADALKERTK